MGKPNRVLANLAKSPFEQVHHFDSEHGYNNRDESAAEDVRDRLKAKGWDSKVTRRSLWHWDYSGGGRKRKKYTGTEYNVWKREKSATK